MVKGLKTGQGGCCWWRKFIRSLGPEFFQLNALSLATLLASCKLSSRRFQFSPSPSFRPDYVCSLSLGEDPCFLGSRVQRKPVAVKRMFSHGG